MPRLAWLVGLSALALVAVGRVVQLAGAPAVSDASQAVVRGRETRAQQGQETGGQQGRETGGQQVRGRETLAQQAQQVRGRETLAQQDRETLAQRGRETRGQQIDAELAQLYALCPESAVVSLEEVVRAPEQVEALLPPVRQTADRVPMIQYPGSGTTRLADGPFTSGTTRLADGPSTSGTTRLAGRPLPMVRYPHPVRVAIRPMPSYRVAAAGDWLVDPGEWFTEEDRERLPGDRTTVPPAAPPADEPSVEPVEEPATEPASPSAEEVPLSRAEDQRLPEPPPRAPAVVEPPIEAAIPAEEPIEPTEPTDEDLALPVEEFAPVEPPGETPAAEPAASSPLFVPPPVADDAAPAAPAVNAPAVPPPGELIVPSPVMPAVPPPSSRTSPPATPSLGEPLVSEPWATGVTEPPASSAPVSAPTSPSPSTPLFSPPAAHDAAPPAVTTPAPLPAPPTSPAPAATQNKPQGPVDPHLELFAKSAYPQARECAKCHEDIYHQWSVSAHAYANISPMFHKFEQKLNDLSQGTVGYFCMRCHAPVATNLCVPRDEPLWNQPEVAREGVTCIACHRVQYMYGKSNGERRIETGPIFAPVFGGIGGEGVAEAIGRKEHFKVKTSPDEKGPGQDIHVTGIYFEQLTRSEFCASCHQVAVHPGIKLEVVWEQYRASPASRKGIQCQDCHMGRVPGLPLGNDIGPVAKIADKTVNEHRVKWNHIFHGPNYPISHPGVFPFHLKADRWNIDQWLLFDWRAGWGTDEFEDAVADGKIAASFPPVWAEADDRYDAREIIEDNLKKLDHKRENREQILENGSHVDGPFFDSPPCRGEDLKFHYIITNTNEGHNLLTASLGAQPQLWANIVLIGPDGRRLWETGYTDSYGDLANIHSVDVRHDRLPFDWQLLNLQTNFLITGVKGTDREFFLPVNVDVDQLPFIRPGAQPISTINHPPFIRMESQSLAPLGSRQVPYKIPGELLRQPGHYRLSFRMRSRAEPPYFMRFCEATPDMLRSMNEWMVDVHPMTVEFYVR